MRMVSISVLRPIRVTLTFSWFPAFLEWRIVGLTFTQSSFIISAYIKRRQTMKKADDREFKDVRIISVKTGKSSWSITREDGWEFFVAKKWGIRPRVGDIARFYGKGIGAIIRGLDINGRECFYRTPKQEAARNARWLRNYYEKKKKEFEKNRAALDVQYNSLPIVFQRRIDKFRKNNPDFRWKYEAIEMFVCVQAVKIADTLKAAVAVRAWHEMSFEDQKRLVPDLDDGHSGNSLGAACALAGLYFENPEGVVRMHGVLAPLVGSKEYGCVPR